MDTPICDFVKEYAIKNTARLHMPGHKGKDILGFEKYDITEIKGADSLYEADSIIAESEKNASLLFDCDTFYSTEGSSLCIRAMMYLAVLYAKAQNKELLVFAGRNAHKTFISASALLGFDIEWLKQDKNTSYHSFSVDFHEFEKNLYEHSDKTKVVYITSPDYLGNIADIKKISKICKKYNALLFVDNAHGAYLKFLENSQHPIDCGADICCDSAHKTLPVLTGGAYLHISKNTNPIFKTNAKNALCLFGSTSPSYLILQSLDMANKTLEKEYKDRLKKVITHIDDLRNTLINSGYTLYGNEPLKITIQTKKYGYTGYDFAELLRQNNIECEFADPDFVVFMLSPNTNDAEITYLTKVLLNIPRQNEINTVPPTMHLPSKKMCVRDAVMSQSALLPVKECIGKTVAITTAACPPAIPIVVSGEVIDEYSVKCFEYYSIDSVYVVME